MDLPASYHAMIDGIVTQTQMSDKLLHVHVGLAIYLGSQIVLRTRRASLDALTIVFAAEAINETMDRLYCGSWRWHDTLTDFAATLFWPLMLVLVGRYRRQRWSRLQKSGRKPMRKLRPALAGVSRRS